MPLVPVGEAAAELVAGVPKAKAKPKPKAKAPAKKKRYRWPSPKTVRNPTCRLIMAGPGIAAVAMLAFGISRLPGPTGRMLNATAETVEALSLK